MALDNTFQPLIYRTRALNQMVVQSGGKITLEDGSIFDNAGAVGGATFTIGDEASNARAITVQLTDAAGNDLASVQSVLMGVFSTATGTAFATTGGTTGIAIGTDGALQALVAKKLFLLTCESNGDIDLTWTDTDVESVYLGILLPNGTLAMSEEILNTWVSASVSPSRSPSASTSPSQSPSVSASISSSVSPSVSSSKSPSVSASVSPSST